MRKTRFLTILALIVLLVVGTSTAEAGKGKKKKRKPVRGVITAVENAQAPGKFTVRVLPKKKQAAENAPPTEKTFTFSKETKFEKLVGKKKDAETRPATFADLHKDYTVLITAGKADEADSIKIFAKKKKKAG
jgi:hypothetical protein